MKTEQNKVEYQGPVRCVRIRDLRAEFFSTGDSVLKMYPARNSIPGLRASIFADFRPLPDEKRASSSYSSSPSDARGRQLIFSLEAEEAPHPLHPLSPYG